MTTREPVSILLLGSHLPLAGLLDTWLHALFTAPLEIASVRTLPEARAYLQTHHVDLAFADESTARNDLRDLCAAAPATAVIGLIMRRDDALLLQMLRQGAHEVLCLYPSAGADHLRTLKQALARVNGRAGLLKDLEAPPASSASPQLIHDLNNLLTSINGFADLLLAQLPLEHPARMGAEQIRLAGKRATTLLKAHSPTAAAAPSPSAPATLPIIARAA